MHHFTALLSSVALLVGATASPLDFKHGAKAVYFQSNKSPNAIAAVKVHPSGKLGNYSFYATGGHGGAEIGSTGPDAPDPLGSQHSVVVYEDFLFTTNAGSNDISLFSIPCNDPTSLSLVGTYPVNGGFPNTIAVKRDTVCVGYAGSPAGISCAKWDSHGVGKFDTVREFDLHQSNPPNASLILVSDAVFARDDSLLVVTARGSSQTPGFVATYEVGWEGEVSDKAGIAVPAGLNSSFGIVPIPETTLAFVAEPELGGYILDVNNPERPVAKIAVPGQKAICWSAVTHRYPTGLFPDAGTNTITQVELPSGRIAQQWNSTNGNKGQLDFSVDATDKFFALAFSPKDSIARVASIDVSGRHFRDIDNIVIAGADTSAQGFAIYP
ncbi:hypothetical protein BGW36DRAFT_354918 [Talaromyces proteolyticus]|uniref:Uncharacterized protein n=1 Tax=Talaromyces proteolyticus TaxID=1131652 RepID=A0AAD4L3F4_9EURO|nr:uncharacterized protein BGW36DRAFT_354918 [Talaromyces proteolyticus]KAH8703498.1 hypothetical protein BGW36DRAFT_354918 [Talaromyces proteolyticus]